MDNIHTINNFFLWVNPGKRLYIKHQLISEICDALILDWTWISALRSPHLTFRTVAQPQATT